MKLNIFSDLRKPGLVPGKSLYLAQNYVFCFGETLIYIMSNRIRNLHKQLKIFYFNIKIFYLSLAVITKTGLVMVTLLHVLRLECCIW